MGSVVGGRYISESHLLAPYFTYSAIGLAWMLVLYGFTASVIPVWLLLAPRGVLSTFVKLGTILLLAGGILAVRPTMLMPPLTRFIDGTGPIFAGKIFPFCFITIACGALSGFQFPDSSGTTPKMLSKEGTGTHGGLRQHAGGIICRGDGDDRCLRAQARYLFLSKQPAGIVGRLPQQAVATISGWGFPVTAQDMSDLATKVGEVTLFNRTGGAPVARGGHGAHLFRVSGRRGDGNLVITFAIMFEALFILTILDAGTRVGRFLLQDLMGHSGSRWANELVPWNYSEQRHHGHSLGILSFPRCDGPAGRHKQFCWPLFGISNQLLAAIALCVCTTILIKMGKSRYILVTLAPLVWLVSGHNDGQRTKNLGARSGPGVPGTRPVPCRANRGRDYRGRQDCGHTRLIFNDRLDAMVTLVFASGGFGDLGRIRSKLVALLFRKEASRPERVASRIVEAHCISRQLARNFC